VISSPDSVRSTSAFIRGSRSSRTKPYT
jgi:hypothetical protein